MQIEQTIVMKHKVKKLKFKFIWFILIQYNNKQNPRIISKKPEGAIFFKEIKNWLSIGFKSTKSKVPSLMCLTISVRFGLNHVLVIPFKIVYIPWIISACSKSHPPMLPAFWKNIDNKKILPTKLNIAVIKSINILVLYSNSEAKDVWRNFSWPFIF